jgi:mannose-6-phosphate isomerase-like protein (cupin superfamily)
MFIHSKDQISRPLVQPLGERVFELVGSLPDSGSARLHSLAHILIPPGKSSASHFHKHAEETYYILAGQARMIVDGQEYTLTPGQACLICAPEVHQIFNDGSVDLEFLAVCAPAWTPEDSFSPGVS